MSPAPDSSPNPGSDGRSGRAISFLWRHREGLSTVLMGLAAVVTAWCAFESAKWAGVQSLEFAKAGASRTESSRRDVIDNLLVDVDVATFLAWIQALGAEQGSDLRRLTGPYRPDPARPSGFLFQRFRPEFRAAIEAWLSTRPLLNEDAPPTPFVMEEYRRPLGARAAVLLSEAEEAVKKGREAVGHSNNYMLVTVASSITIFFAGMSSKLTLPGNGLALLLMACVSFAISVAAIVSLPKIVF